jgi:chemotaxis protein histidine kinase CheA
MKFRKMRGGGLTFKNFQEFKETYEMSKSALNRQTTPDATKEILRTRIEEYKEDNPEYYKAYTDPTYKETDDFKQFEAAAESKAAPEAKAAAEAKAATQAKPATEAKAAPAKVATQANISLSYDEFKKKFNDLAQAIQQNSTDGLDIKELKTEISQLELKYPQYKQSKIEEDNKIEGHRKLEQQKIIERTNQSVREFEQKHGKVEWKGLPY